MTDRRRVVAAVVGVTAAVAGWAALGAGARATPVERLTADEPQYVLSALSLIEDRSLDIGDELADERARDFNEVALPRQTRPLSDGRELSPHDPLLPVLLAGPVGLGGWLGAKLALAALAGVLAGLLVWTAVRRLAVPLPAAVVTVLAFGLSSPLATYGTQIYPELPAALAVTVVVAAATGRWRRPALVVAALAIVALPWLSVKYAAVAAVLALLLLARAWRHDRPAAVVTLVALGLAGGAYLTAHQILYEGWTAYSAGDHFATGEFSVVGSAPNYPGRSVRLLGLLVDRDFGLAAWAPVTLLAVPALAALVRRRPEGWAWLVLPAAAGWLNASWVALTMHGFWWPGRQVIVILPLFVLAVATWVRDSPGRRVVAGLGAFGAASWLVFLNRVRADGWTLVIDVDRTPGVLSGAWRAVLPDLRTPAGLDWVLYSVWAVLALAAIGFTRRTTPAEPASVRHEDAGAGEGTDAHVAATDLDGGGAVR